MKKILAVAAFTLMCGAAFGQSDVMENGGPLSGPPALNAPFTADATTTVMQRLTDGSRIERKMIAHYYRDAAGRDAPHCRMSD